MTGRPAETWNAVDSAVLLTVAKHRWPRGERYPWQVAVESCVAAVFSTLTLPLTIKRHVASAPADWALTKYGGSVMSLVKVQVQVR